MAETTTNGERPREDPEKTLWMGDLAFEWDEAFIADLFEGFGNVTAYRPYDPRADRPTLYAFVTFESEAEATRAFEELNGATIPDTRRRFRLNPRSKRPERPSERMARKRPRSRSPGGYDRRSPPGGRLRMLLRLMPWLSNCETASAIASSTSISNSSMFSCTTCRRARMRGEDFR